MDRERENNTNANSGKSLPPRSTIHKAKEENPNKNQKNTLYMIIASAIFAIIIITFLYNQFSTPGDNVADPGTEYNIPGEQDDSGSGDKTGDLDPNDDNTGNIGDGTDTDEPGEPVGDTNEGDGDADQPTPDNGDGENVDDPSQEENQVHVIEAGENLYRISLKYYDSGSYFNELAIYNGLSDADDIYAGLEIKIPPVEKLQQSQSEQ